MELPDIEYTATVDEGLGFSYEVQVCGDFSYITYYEGINEHKKKIHEMQIPTNYAKQIAKAILTLEEQLS
jgi:hypothetical protein